MLTALDIFEKFGPNATPALDGFQFDGIAVYAHNEIVDQYKVVWTGEFYGIIGYENVTEFLSDFKCWVDNDGTWVPTFAYFGNSRTGASQYMRI